jgi:hypothetical protein
MYVFSIDIPFKGSQSLSNMKFKVTSVSYLHSGVIDTIEYVIAVPMTTLCRAQPSQSQWHSCDTHSGVIDTSVTGTAVPLTPQCNQLFFENLR